MAAKKRLLFYTFIIFSFFLSFCDAQKKQSSILSLQQDVIQEKLKSKNNTIKRKGTIEKYGVHQIDESYVATVTKKALSLSGPITVKILNGGYSGASIFTVSSDSKKYVVRFLEHKTKEARQNEIACLKIASQEGYGPHIYFSDVDQSVVIMDLLFNQDISLQQRQSDCLYIYLAQLLQKIHSGPKFGNYRNIFNDIQGCIKVVKKNLEAQNIDSIPLAKIEKIIDILHDTLLSHLITTPCHNDLHPNNLMFCGDKFKAIDYEYASQEDPYYDIAEIALFYCFNPAHEKILLSTYLERQPSAKEEAKLYFMKQVALIYYAIFFLEINPEQLHKYEKLQVPLDIDFIKEIAEGKLENTTDVLKSAKFLINYIVANFESKKFSNALKILREKDGLPSA